MAEMTTEKPKSFGNKMANVAVLSLKVITKITSISAKMTKLALAGISFAAYSYMYSWKFSLILMVQLLIHEYGHIWAMKRVGIKTKGIYFIPFVGGAAVASEDFKTRNDEVFVAIMGPIFGFACALAMMIIYYVTENPMYAAGASWMAMVNLFNLLPINPLDGGRIMKSIAFSIHSWVGLIFMCLGIAGAIFLAIYAHIWIFILVVILSTIELVLEFWLLNKRKKYNALLNNEYYSILNHINSIEKDYNDKNVPIPTELAKYLVETKENLRKPEMPEEKPIMNLRQILMATLQYFALGFVLYSFMAITSHIPGARLAMEMLQ